MAAAGPPAGHPTAAPAPFGPDDDERDAPGGRDVYAAASQRRDGAREAALREGLGRDAARRPDAPATPPPGRPASPFVLPPRLGGPKPPDVARPGANGAPGAGANGAGTHGARPGVNGAGNGRPGPANGRAAPADADGAAGAAPPPEPPPPPKIPSDPAKAWVFALGVLNPFQRTELLENTAFGGFADGTLTLSIRNERYRGKFREWLLDVDFVSVLPGFRRFEIKLGDEGRTGREARNEADERRVAAAREAVAASALVKRLVALLDGRVEQVEASMLDGGDRSATNNEEGSDE